jgi:hypothetical protein
MTLCYLISSSLGLISGQGELAHRALKAFYPLTSKLDTPAQLAKHEHHHCVLQQVMETGHSCKQVPVKLPATRFKGHYYIPKLSRNNTLDIFSFLWDHDNDPAVAVSTALFSVHLGSP